MTADCARCERLEEEIERWRAVADFRLEEATSYRRRLVTLERALLRYLSSSPGSTAAEELRRLLEDSWHSHDADGARRRT